MPPAKRRKTAAVSEALDRDAEGQAPSSEPQGTQTVDKPHEDKEPVTVDTGDASVDQNKERQERFKALQARAVSPGPMNLMATAKLTLSLAKVSQNKPERSSRRIPTSGHRSQPSFFTFPQTRLCLTQPAKS